MRSCFARMSSSFLLSLPAERDRNKRETADCIFSTKNRSRFPKTQKLASLYSLRFYTENFSDFLYAPKMMSALLSSYNHPENNF